MKLTHIACVAFAVLFAFGCSASKKSKSAASGTAKSATTKQPPSTPKPSKKAGANVTSNASSAAAVEGDATCTADEDAQGACADTFVVFCSDTKVYALDCAEAFGGTCGELDDGTVDCVVDE